MGHSSMRCHAPSARAHSQPHMPAPVRPLSYWCQAPGARRSAFTRSVACEKAPFCGCGCICAHVTMHLAQHLACATGPSEGEDDFGQHVHLPWFKNLVGRSAPRSLARLLLGSIGRHFVSAWLSRTSDCTAFCAEPSRRGTKASNATQAKKRIMPIQFTCGSAQWLYLKDWADFHVHHHDASAYARS